MRRFPVEKDGLVFILPTLAVTGLLFAFRFPGSGIVVLLLAAFIVYFFRDPEREIPQGERLILSPADGKVVTIKPFPDWKGPFGEPLMRFHRSSASVDHQEFAGLSRECGGGR